MSRESAKTASKRVETAERREVCRCVNSKRLHDCIGLWLYVTSTKRAVARPEMTVKEI